MSLRVPFLFLAAQADSRVGVLENHLWELSRTSCYWRSREKKMLHVPAIMVWEGPTPQREPGWGSSAEEREACVHGCWLSSDEKIGEHVLELHFLAIHLLLSDLRLLCLE